jgi:hypothetical protein
MPGSWDDIDILFESDGGGGYDWDVDALVARTLDDGRREYAHYSDAGCSCNWAYEDDVESYDLAWDINLRAVADQVRNAIRGDIDGLAKLNTAVQKERLSK